MSENITPAYREEKLLANIAGEDYDVVAATREEKLLANIAGGDYDVVAATRKEKLLEEIAGSGLIRPEGSIEITENGTYDVTEYASAEVATPVPGLARILIVNNSSVDVAVDNTLSIVAAGPTMNRPRFSIASNTSAEANLQFGTTLKNAAGTVTLVVLNDAVNNLVFTFDGTAKQEQGRYASGSSRTAINLYLLASDNGYTLTISDVPAAS